MICLNLMKLWINLAPYSMKLEIIYILHTLIAYKRPLNIEEVTFWVPNM